MKKISLLKITLLGLILSTLLIGYFYQKLHSPHVRENSIFKITSGETFAQINYRLFKAGLINDQRIFHYYAKYKKLLTKFKVGEFTIPQGSSIPEVVYILVSGTPNLTQVTIPEGKNMYEIADILAANKITSKKDFLTEVRNKELMKSFSIPPSSPSLEGYLFPETYKFSPNSSAKYVIKTMLKLFHLKTKNLYFNHPFLSKHEIINLASIVEKETGAKFERPLIAGVFTNRLKKKMRLQSDPTTVYGMWDRYKGNIKKSDLLEYTPYNTYKIPALPLGPIANPSLEAIEAVLQPAHTNYLYFVSKNDGTHVFSETYKSHREAVDAYQKNAQARRGKSWRQLKQ